MPHRLSNADYRMILGALEAAHWARDRKTLFFSVCESLDRCIGSSSGVLLPLDPATGIFRHEGAVNVNIDDRAFADFFTYYAPRHPLVEKNLHRTTINQSLRQRLERPVLVERHGLGGRWLWRHRPSGGIVPGEDVPCPPRV